MADTGHKSLEVKSNEKQNRNMRNLFNCMLIAFAMSVLVVGCKKSEDKIEPPVTHPLTKLKFSPEKTIIEQGKTTEVTIVGTLKSTDKVKIINEEIVTLQEAVTNNKIKLLAKKVGTTQVQVLTEEGKERGSFEVTVTPVFKLSFTPETPSVELGKTTEVAIIGTLNTTDKVQIADEAIVAQQGAITNNKINLLAKKIGTTKVSISTADGKERGSFEVKVTLVFELHFTPEAPIMEVGKTTEVTIVGTLNATDRVQIANETVVAQQGSITNNKISLLAKKIGTTKVSIFTADGKERGAFEVKVTPIFELHFTPETTTVEVDKTTIVSIVGILNATDKVQIADETVISLQGAITDNKINLLAKKVGTTKVSILTADGKERGAFEVKVTPKLLLSFSPAKITIEQEKTATVSFSGVWNDSDKVQIADEAIVALQGKVTNNKINLLAKNIGTTQVRVLTADGRERGTFEVKVTPKLLLSFTPTKAVIKKGETTTVTFSGVWNTTDRVQITDEAIASLQGTVNNNKINLLANRVGSTKVYVYTAEGQSRGSFEVVVYEEPKKMTLSYKSNLPHYKTEITNKEEYKHLIEETLRTYELLKRELEELDKYPLDKYRYHDQDALYLEGIRISRAAKQYYKDNKDTASLKQLKHTYENLHQYGIDYTEVEIMVRLAEQYRKEFPHSTEIENIIRDNFNGEYGNLDGPPLTNYLNNNIVKPFNDIIDIVNRIRKKKKKREKQFFTLHFLLTYTPLP